LKTRLLLLFVVTCLISVNLFAGGFQTATQGAKAMGMGLAFVGQASDASSIYYNAAGITNTSGFNVLFGTTLIMPSVDFTGPNTSTIKSTTVDRTFTPINFYATYSMDNGLSFGLGVYNPYGLGSEWPEDWIGKALAVKTELKTFYINPTVAYKVSDKFSIGVGLDYIISNAQFLQNIDIPAIPLATAVLPAAPNVGVNFEGDGDAAFTFNVGLQYKATEDLSVGLSYRHQAEITINGDLTFENLPAKPAGFPVGHSDLFPEGSGVAKLTMPYDLRAGVSYNAMENLTINVDFQYAGWESYKELAVDFEKNTPVWKDLKTAKDWKNSFTFRLGGEYRLNALALRAGYAFDATPIPTKTMDPSLPGADRHDITLGLGYQITPNIRVDAAYQHFSYDQNVTDSGLKPPNGFNGLYETSTNLFGFNLEFAF